MSKNSRSAMKFIKLSDLNHFQFHQFLPNIKSEYSNILYFCVVCWYSKCDILRNVYDLLKEFYSFVKSFQIQSFGVSQCGSNCLIQHVHKLRTVYAYNQIPQFVQMKTENCRHLKSTVGKTFEYYVLNYITVPYITLNCAVVLYVLWSCLITITPQMVCMCECTEYCCMTEFNAIQNPTFSLTFYGLRSSC